MNADIEELHAMCHIFGVKFICDTPDALDSNRTALFTVSDSGRLNRQVTVTGRNPDVWRAAIKRLLSDKPQDLWETGATAWARSRKA